MKKTLIFGHKNPEYTICEALNSLQKIKIKEDKLFKNLDTVWTVIEKIEKKIANAGFDQIKIGLQEVSDDALDKVAGGWKCYDAEVRCRCGNGNRDDFSYQFWASSLYGPRTKKYRCKKCNSYMKVTYDWAYEHAEIEYYE